MLLTEVFSTQIQYVNVIGKYHWPADVSGEWEASGPEAFTPRGATRNFQIEHSFSRFAARFAAPLHGQSFPVGLVPPWNRIFLATFMR